MRTKHPAKDPGTSSSTGSSCCSDPTLAPFADLRKTEARYVSARGKSKCASVRECSRSGGSTPRTSESPSPKLTAGEAAEVSETPRTFLIKDSFCEPDVKLAELCQPQPSCNRFLSEVDELDWFYDQDRSKGGGGTSCSSEVSVKEFLKGKSPQVEKVAEVRGKGPMAFPTEFESGSEMPPWLQNAYRSLTRLDDEDDKNDEEEVAEKAEASCSTRGKGDEVGNVAKDGLREDESSETGAGSRDSDQQEGAGWLWKMSMCASVSFVTWVLMNGARIQCRSLFPTIREREQPAKIVRRKPSRVRRSSSADEQQQQQKFC